MQSLYEFLRKYNCIWVRIETSGSLSLRVFGHYSTETPTGLYPLSELVYVEDFPTLMNTFGELSTSAEPRIYTHFRIELDNELHWAYLCCEKAEEKGAYRGILLDVYEYLDSVPTDNVIAAFETRQKSKISDLNDNGATLEEICGVDYLKKVQLPFSKLGVETAIYDEKEKLICSWPEKTDVAHSGHKHIQKAAIRFNYKDGGWWYVAADSEENTKSAGIMLEGLADTLSRIAHSFVLLYNETENSRAVNKQLGMNVEQQLMINNIYSIIMDEPESEKALSRVLEMTAKYLHVDRIAAYLPTGSDRVPTLICSYENESGKQSTLDEYITQNFEGTLSRLGMADHFFTENTHQYYHDTNMAAFAISKISAGKNGVGLLFYQVYDDTRPRNGYNDRRIIRSVSQVISGLILRREMDEEIKEKNEQLTRLAFYDTTLGIRNRAKLDADAKELIENNDTGIVMAVQILNTRALNEVFGQNYTDKLLRIISEYLSLPEIGGESVYRFSGSIIFLLLAGKNSEEAQSLAQDILLRFSKPFLLDGIEQYAEAAVGIAAFSPAFASTEDLYRAATLSLYRANEYGKNSIAFFSREFHSSTSSAYHLEQELRRCIADDMRNFELVFQPVYLKNTVDHYETLLRWRSEKEGRVSPRVFMKLMEKVGLDSAIDFWVIPRALRFCREIREQTGENIRISINLTTREMQGGLIPGAIQSALNETNLPPDAIIAEVPEAAHVLAGNDTAATLGKLKKMGVLVCVDSFGSEYLPLHVLKYSYIDMVKLSASFVTNSGDSFDEALVNTVTSLAGSRGIKVIVKNIQYEAQLNAAKSYGLDCFQGELLTPPVTADEIKQRLMAQNEEDCG